MAESLERLAQIAVADALPEYALYLYGFASLVREEVGTPLSPDDRAEHDRVLGAARAQLPRARADSAWNAGRALSLEDAIDLALNPPEPPDLTPPPASPVAVLSPRETEVLRLVAEGQTNQEIAATLFISPNTVTNHVTNILNKLGLDSRTAAAAWAIRQGLA